MTVHSTMSDRPLTITSLFHHGRANQVNLEHLVRVLFGGIAGRPIPMEDS